MNIVRTIRTVVILLSILSISRPTLGQADTNHKETIPATEGGTLIIEADCGNVTITTHNEASVKLDLFNVKGPNKELDISKDDNVIKIDFDVEDETRDDDEVRFVISVPRMFSLDVKTAGGDIVLKKELQGSVNATTAGGDINIPNVKGNIDVTTAGGNIRLERIDGDVEAVTAGGDISVGAVNGAAQLQTAGGNIRVKTVGKSLQAETAGGNIDVGDVGGDTDASTAGGDISAGSVAGTVRLTVMGGDIRLQGAQQDARISSMGGNIELKDMKGDFSVTTMGGDITVSAIPPASGRGSIETMAGDINLLIDANANATITASVTGVFASDDDTAIYSDFDADNRMGTKNRAERRIFSTESKRRFVLNDGGFKLSLHTQQGSISIRKK